EKTRIAKSDWGLLYVFNLSSWESYFIALEKARELDRDFGAKDLTVFVSSYSLNEPIPDVREALRGIVKRGYNIYMPPSFAKKTDHRINFVDIRSHLAEGLFDERFLLSKDLPLVIRGPHTLIKAVYLAAKDKEGLIWAWEPQPHQKAAKEQFPVFLKEKSGLDKKDQSLIIDMTNNGVNNPEIFLLRSKYRQIWREFSQAILKNLDFEKGIKAKVDEWAVSSPALNRVTVGSSPVEEKNRTVPGSPISRESLLDALREALTKVGLPKHVIERAEQIIQEWGDASVSSSGIRSLVSRDKNSRKQSSSSVNKEFGNTPVQTRSSSPAITSETGIARDAPKQLSLKLAVCTLHLRQSILGLTSRPISDAIVRRADREFPNIFYDTQEYYLYDIVRVLRNSRDTYHNLFSLISLISNQLEVCKELIDFVVLITDAGIVSNNDEPVESGEFVYPLLIVQNGMHTRKIGMTIFSTYDYERAVAPATSEAYIEFVTNVVFEQISTGLSLHGPPAGKSFSLGRKTVSSPLSKGRTRALTIAAASPMSKEESQASIRCGLMSLDSNGGAKSSIPTMITGWLGSFWVRLIRSPHSLKSALPLIWKTIWALSGIWSSISGWAKTYLLNSAESVLCNCQKYLSSIISNPLQITTLIYLPVFIQIFISIGQCFFIIESGHPYLLNLSTIMDNVTMGKSVSGIVSYYWLPAPLYQDFQLNHKLDYFIFITMMFVTFATVRSIRSNKTFNLNVFGHKNNILNLKNKVNDFYSLIVSIVSPMESVIATICNAGLKRDGQSASSP
ncbi:MAG: hypothetical protein WAX79_00135, partial [Candidatus Omnitrophota bacterium]